MLTPGFHFGEKKAEREARPSPTGRYEDGAGVRCLHEDQLSTDMLRFKAYSGYVAEWPICVERMAQADSFALSALRYATISSWTKSRNAEMRLDCRNSSG